MNWIGLDPIGFGYEVGRNHVSCDPATSASALLIVEILPSVVQLATVEEVCESLVFRWRRLLWCRHRHLCGDTAVVGVVEEVIVMTRGGPGFDLASALADWNMNGLG